MDEIGDEWGIFLDMEVYFTIYFLFFFGGYHGISPFSDGRSHSLWRSHSRCVLLVKIYMEVFQFMGYHGVPVNHPVEIGIFHYKLSSYWGSHFGKSPYELRDSPASLGRKPPSM